MSYNNRLEGKNSSYLQSSFWRYSWFITELKYYNKNLNVSWKLTFKLKCVNCVKEHDLEGYTH